MTTIKPLTKTQVNNQIKLVKEANEEMNSAYMKGVIDGLRWCHDRIIPLEESDK